MAELADREIEYTYDGARLLGHYVAEAGSRRPGLLLVHDASGVSRAMKDAAGRAAELGYAVLLADLWGEGRMPRGDDEIAPLIGALVADRETWVGRIRSAHQTLLAQPEVDPDNVAAFGYCFGGASVLEYARAGAEVKAVVSFHGGLDAVSPDWSSGAASAKVLVLTGAEDPMATPDLVDALQAGLTTAGVDWEVCCYGGAKHGFTDRDADKASQSEMIAYSARADRRSWNAFRLFLEEIFEGGDNDA